MKKLIGAILGIALVCMVCLVVRDAQPKRIAVNVVISDAGRYFSPSGKQIVDISRQENGTLKFFVSNSVDGRSGSGPATPFQAKSAWFMSWDSTDRLWTYVPDQDRQYCRYWYTNERGSGSCLVGEGGGWEGIPDSFVAHLPETAKATYTTYAKVR